MWLQARRRNRQKHLTLTHQHSTPFSLSWQPKGHYVESRSECYPDLSCHVISISFAPYEPHAWWGRCLVATPDGPDSAQADNSCWILQNKIEVGTDNDFYLLPWLTVDKSWVGPLLMHKKLHFIILAKFRIIQTGPASAGTMGTIYQAWLIRRWEREKQDTDVNRERTLGFVPFVIPW